MTIMSSKISLIGSNRTHRDWSQVVVDLEQLSKQVSLLADMSIAIREQFYELLESLPEELS